MEPQNQGSDGLMPVALVVTAVVVAGLVAGRDGAIVVGTIATIVAFAHSARSIPWPRQSTPPPGGTRVATGTPAPVAPPASPLAATLASPASHDPMSTGSAPPPAKPAPGAIPRVNATWSEFWLPWLRAKFAPALALVRADCDRLLLAAIAGFALIIRLTSISTIPLNITADEKDNTEVVIRIIETGHPGWFGLDWKPAPAFSVHVIRLFMAIFGVTPLGLRAASIVMSSLALILFVVIARRVVNPWCAYGAAILLASGRWYLHFSRSGWENVQSGLYALLAVWALTVALETGRYRWFALAGCGAALGLYGYFGGRLVLPVLFAYLPFAWWFSREQSPAPTLPGAATSSPARSDRPAYAQFTLMRLGLGFGLIALVAVGLFLPQLRTIQRNWDYFNQRVSAVSVFKQPRPYLGDSSDRAIVESQIRRTIDTFIFQRGGILNNGRYSQPGLPLFDRVTGLLVIAGFLLGLWRWRQTALWWLMLLIPLFATQVLSAGTPDAARAVPVAPFFYLFVALALDGCYRALKRALPYVAFTPLLCLVFLVSAANVQDYFRWIQTPNATEVRGPSLTYAEYPIWVAQKRCQFHDQDAVTDASGHVQCVARTQ